MKILLSVWRFFVCRHDWWHVRRIKEQNIRQGYKHQSDIYQCSICHKIKTVEVPGSQTK